jgi:hypothetical protein
LGKEALLLDLVGNLTLVNLESGGAGFSFSSAGSLDAVFRDPQHIIIGQSAPQGRNTPFLLVNTETGETVPLRYPAAIGAQVYQGSGGTLYGAVIDSSAGSAKTSILQLDLNRPESSVPLAEYQGEDSGFYMAESGGILASTLGGDGATLYHPQGQIPFERSSGLPLRLIGTETCFVTLDSEGNIAWHDNQSGKLLALLRLYGEEWVLEKPGGERLGGKLNSEKHGRNAE